MIIVFPFIVLKYFSFCCHSSHSILFRNPLGYSCFVLFVKSDSKLNQNSSCYFFILFNLFVTHLCLYPFFIFLTLLFLFQDRIFYAFCLFCYSVSFITLSFLILFFLLFCFYVILSFLLFCLYVILSLVILSLFIFLSHFLSPFFSFILASFLPFHVFIF